MGLTRLERVVCVTGAVCAWGAVPPAMGTVVRDDVAQVQSAALGSLMPGAARIGVLGGVGSGTLIAPGWVLTAAHVVSDGSGVARSAGVIGVEVGGQSLGVTEVVLHPAWTGANYGAGVDVALLRLSGVALTTPAGLALGEVSGGAEVVLAGFGAFGTGESGLLSGPGVLHGVSNRIDGRGTDVFAGWSDGLLLLDVDGPDGTMNRLGSSSQSTYEGGAAIGDSGGGVYVLQNGAWALGGVLSFTFTLGPVSATFGYGTLGASVSVATHRAWIDSVVPAPGGGLVLALLGAGAARRKRNAPPVAGRE